MTSVSATALLAFSASLPASQAPRAGVASSMSSYVMVAPPTLLPTSSSAIFIALTIVSVWPLLLPVLGSDETILIEPLSWPGAVVAGDAAATGDEAGAAAT